MEKAHWLVLAVGESRLGLCAAALGQDVGSALRDRLDKPFLAQHLDGPAGGVSGHAEQVYEVFLRWQWVFAGPELAGFDP